MWCLPGIKCLDASALDQDCRLFESNITPWPCCSKLSVDDLKKQTFGLKIFVGGHSAPLLSSREKRPLVRVVCTDGEEEREGETCWESVSVCLLHWNSVFSLPWHAHPYTPSHSFWGSVLLCRQIPHTLLPSNSGKPGYRDSILVIIDSHTIRLCGRLLWKQSVKAMWGHARCRSRQTSLLLMQATSEQGDRRFSLKKTKTFYLITCTPTASPSIKQTCPAVILHASHMACKRQKTGTDQTLIGPK